MIRPERSIDDYADIVDLPHHRSSVYPHMTPDERAAQFSPFAALTGLDDAMEETARLTDSRIELDEDAKAALNSALNYINVLPPGERQCRLTYFVPDKHKEGGAYVTLSCAVKRIDAACRRILLTDGRAIDMDDMVEIEIDDRADRGDDL